MSESSAERAAREFEREARRLLELADRYRAGARGERIVAAELQALTGIGCRLLVDRRWPRHAEANIDVIAVGAMGVVVVDAKNWHHAPTTVGGVLRRYGQDCSAELANIQGAVRSVERALSPLGISPVVVSAMMAFVNHTVDERLGSVHLIGARHAATAIADMPVRLKPADVLRVEECLAEAFPPHVPAAVPDSDAAPGDPTTISDVYAMLDAHRRRARQGPIEAWMTYLDPTQHDLVRHDFAGPALVRGPAGTGKTVVALHRAAHLARLGERVLFLTFVKSLATVQHNLLRRLEPHAARHIDVRTIDSLAREIVTRRHRAPAVETERLRRLFDTAWSRVGRRALGHLDPMPRYWRDEIEYVVKGRGIAGLDEYLRAQRRGRRTPLQNTHRQAVWALYTEYERMRTEEGLLDFPDVRLLALEELRRTPWTGRYSAAIIDEAQDITLTGLRLVHALVGNRRNGLLLVGDARQSIYAGGHTVADASVDIRGRSRVLRVNYRNANAIIAAADHVLEGTPVEDIDGEDVDYGEVRADRPEGVVATFVAASVEEMDEELVRLLRALPEPAAAAVLCADRHSVGRYVALLSRAGLAVQDLEEYAGLATDAVKVGTFARSKGLEFKHVYLPGYDRALREAATGGATDPDRRDRAAAELHVAMYRARDTLWLGSVPSATRRDDSRLDRVPRDRLD